MREKGVEATSVADVMADAGLTHGGFYRHFASKDEMATAAFRHAVNDVVADVETSTSARKRAKARDRYIKTYLSVTHVEELGRGCPLAAMATEVSRLDGGLHEAAADAVWRMAKILPEADLDQSTEQDSQGLAIMAILLGTITLARLAESQSDVDTILSAGRAGLKVIEDSWTS